MTTMPADLVNRAIDSIGHPIAVGELQEGTLEARTALRIYGPTRNQLLRAAHWNFARRQAYLTLLNDATGVTTQQQIAAGLTPTVGTGTIGMGLWQYEYQWPTDGLKARYVPATFYGNPGAANSIAVPPVPPTTGLGSTTPFVRQQPAPFLVTNDTVPTMVGNPTTWAQFPDLADVQGQGYQQQTVILTNQWNATLVYTALIVTPDEMDPLFQQAFVAWMAAQLALTILPDKKAAIIIRREQIAIAKQALEQARITDGNEGWSTVDHRPDWMRTRNSGAWGGAWGPGYNGPGMLWGGWDSCAFGDGAAY